MSCYHPFKLFPIGINKETGKPKYVMSPFWHDFATNDNGVKVYDFKVGKCGRCIGCRLDYARQWSVRSVLESYSHKFNYFITLTYSDDKIPFNNNLVKKDLQDFFKRLRRHGFVFKYLACGEYGETTLRPHYHMIYFGDSPFPDLVQYGTYVKNSYRFNIFGSKKLESIWTHGNCRIEDFNYKTAGYVARYSLKKYATDFSIYEKFNRSLPFLLMSRNPGLGHDYFLNHPEIYDCDELFISDFDKPIKTTPPKYFDNLLEKSDPDLYQSIKDAREVRALGSLSFNTDLPVEDYLKRCEESKQRSIKKLKRGMV